MIKFGCETGGDCTKTTVCQAELVADKLAEALDTLVSALLPLRGNDGTGPLFDAINDAQEALKEYRDNAA